jgi:hypothetical protein
MKFLTRLFKGKPDYEKIGLKALEDLEKFLTRVPISYENNAAAIKVDQKSYVSIPSDRYIEVADGVFDRVVTGKKDIIFDYEKVFIPYLQHIDFEKNIVLFAKFSKKAKFDAHYHPVIETIYCIEGKYKGYSDIVYEKGDIQIIPPNKLHIFEGVEDGLCIVILSKSNN